MNEKMITLAIESLSNKIAALEQENKELKFQFTALKQSFDSIRKSGATNEPDKPDELVSFAQVRKILCLSRNSVNKMIENGKLRLIRLNTSARRFSKKEVQALIANP